MRTYDVVVSFGLIGLAFGLSPAASFDGSRSPDGPIIAVPVPIPAPGSRSLSKAPLAAVPVCPDTPPPASRGKKG